MHVMCAVLLMLARRAGVGCARTVPRTCPPPHHLARLHAVPDEDHPRIDPTPVGLRQARSLRLRALPRAAASAGAAVATRAKGRVAVEQQVHVRRLRQVGREYLRPNPLAHVVNDRVTIQVEHPAERREARRGRRRDGARELVRSPRACFFATLKQREHCLRLEPELHRLIVLGRKLDEAWHPGARVVVGRLAEPDVAVAVGDGPIPSNLNSGGAPGVGAHEIAREDRADAAAHRTRAWRPLADRSSISSRQHQLPHCGGTKARRPNLRLTEMAPWETVI
eukprot:scaffold40069_cov74-Phaeocystis_antarctica.AAC.6